MNAVANAIYPIENSKKQVDNIASFVVLVTTVSSSQKNKAGGLLDLLLYSEIVLTSEKRV